MSKLEIGNKNCLLTGGLLEAKSIEIAYDACNGVIKYTYPKNSKVIITFTNYATDEWRGLSESHSESLENIKKKLIAEADALSEGELIIDKQKIKDLSPELDWDKSVDFTTKNK